MSTTTRIRSIIFAVLAGALFIPAGHLSAQTTHDDQGVVVLNESLHEVRVFAYDDDPDERELLGWVGSDELEFFTVPEDVKDEQGDYRVAVQQVTPLPQLGVPADPYPILSTPAIDPEPNETLRLIVEEDMELSTAVVR